MPDSSSDEENEEDRLSIKHSSNLYVSEKTRALIAKQIKKGIKKISIERLVSEVFKIVNVLYVQ